MIRAARAADLPQLLALVQDLAAFHGDEPQASSATLARDLFGPAPWARALVAEAGGQLTGYALLLPLMRAHMGQRGLDLHHLFVVPSARGTGLGRALISAVRDLARAEGCSYLTVSTQPQNAAAREFYQHCGFFAAPPAPDRQALDLPKD